MKCNSNLILGSLKKILKSKKVTYEQVAKKSGIPVSTVKKVFAGQNIPLNRLIDICDAIDLDFFDLVEEAKTATEEKGFRLSYEQEEFLAKNMIYYYYLVMLIEEKKTVQKIRRELKLSKPENFKILRKFEEFGILDLYAQEKVRLNFSPPFYFRQNGALRRAVYHSITDNFIDWVKHTPEIGIDDQRNSIVKLSTGLTSRQTLEEMFRALEDLEKEFGKRAERDRKFANESDLVPFTWYLALGNYDGFSKPKKVTRI